jgi:quercetin dioxygenase-like cupin family protein
MHVHDFAKEQRWDPKEHVENILGREGGGDFSVACWEPGQVSPYHCHPMATEIYFCFSGGGKMHTPEKTVDIVPGSFVVHPMGELHEYENGPQRTLLFRVRYGQDTVMRHIGWRGHPDKPPSKDDAEYFAKHPPGITFNPNGVSR